MMHPLTYLVVICQHVRLVHEYLHIDIWVRSPCGDDCLYQPWDRVVEVVLCTHYMSTPGIQTGKCQENLNVNNKHERGELMQRQACQGRVPRTVPELEGNGRAREP
jgi:hypothetical protein